METFRCSTCQKTFSVTDFATGAVKQKDGKLFCANCLIGAKHVNRTSCAKCGHYDSPLYDGRVYLCRKCGGEMGPVERELQAFRESEDPRSCAPVAVKKCPFCAESIPVEALVCSHCNSSLRGTPAYPVAAEPRTSMLPVVLFAAAFLLSVGLAVYAIVFSYRQGHSAVPPEPRSDAEVKRLVESQREEFRKAMDEMAANLRKEYATLPEAVTARLQRDSRTADGSTADRDRLEKTDAILQKLDQQLQDLERRQERIAQDLVKSAAEPRPRPAVSPDPAPVTPAPAPSADGSFDEFRKAAEEEMNALSKYQFGRAIRAWEAFLGKFPNSPLKALAQEKKEWHEKEAWKVYNEQVKADVKKYIDEGKFDDAVKLYDDVIEYFGVPDLVLQAKQELRRIKDVKDARARSTISLEGKGLDDVTARKEERTPAGTGEPRATSAGGTASPTPKRPSMPTDPDALVALLDDTIRTSPTERQKAVQGLTGRKEPKIVAALVGALKDPSWGVQEKAIEALGATGDLSVVDEIIRKLDHDMLPVRDAAVKALERLTKAGLGDQGGSRAWQDWWDTNRERLGAPPKPVPLKQAGSAIALPADGTGAKSNSPVIVAVKEDQQPPVVIFQLEGLNPSPKIGDVLNVVRGTQWIGRIEVTQTNQSLKIARGIITDQLPNETPRKEDRVER